VYSLLFTLISFSPCAEAAGYYFSDSGIVSTGRGGAWIAGADNQFAQQHNPAGLIHIEVPTLNVGITSVQQRNSFAPLLSSDSEELADAIVNDAAPFNVPQLGFAAPINDNLVFAFGFVSPYAPNSDYPADGAQRYSLVDSSIYQFGFGPALAWRPIEALTVGLNLQWQFLQVGQRFDATLSGDTQPGGDIDVDLFTIDSFTPYANFGILIDPVPAVTIGLAVQPASLFKGQGHLAIDFTGNDFEDLIAAPECDAADQADCPTAFRDDDIKLDVRLPVIIKTGVAVRPIPKLEIETAFIFQNWKSLSSLTVTDIDLALDVAVLGEQAVDNELSLPANFIDAYSIRLGGEYEVNDLLDVRAGGFYETAAVAPELVSIASMDTAKVQMGGGFSLNLLDNRLVFDTGFAYILFNELKMRNSQVAQVNAGVADPELPLPGLSNDSAIIGNGDFNSYGWILGTQLSWAFRKRE
jgi:long-chain fatty acid transport protein